LRELILPAEICSKRYGSPENHANNFSWETSHRRYYIGSKTGRKEKVKWEGKKREIPR
jgi:hypothetical protein